MRPIRDIMSSLTSTRVWTRKDGKSIIIPTRRDMSRGTPAPGVQGFTRHANARAKAANRARNKQARASRKRNRVH